MGVAIALVLGCAGVPRAEPDDYLPHVGIVARGEAPMALRWHDRDFPLTVHLPQPPAGWFEDPQRVFEAVRAGFTDWQGVARPGVPSFLFVPTAAGSDIRVLWVVKPGGGGWRVAHTVAAPNVTARKHDVEHILVTARWPNGEVAETADIRAVMLHEVGHALGLHGHSPHARDVMSGVHGLAPYALSERDRATLRRLYALPNGAPIEPTEAR